MHVTHAPSVHGHHHERRSRQTSRQEDVSHESRDARARMCKYARAMWTCSARPSPSVYAHRTFLCFGTSPRPRLRLCHCNCVLIDQRSLGSTLLPLLLQVDRCFAQHRGHTSHTLVQLRPCPPSRLSGCCCCRLPLIGFESVELIAEGYCSKVLDLCRTGQSVLKC